MSNLAEEQDFEDETVAEAIEKAKGSKKDESDFEIEVIDDLPPEHQNRPRQAKDAKVDSSLSDDDDEIKSYSESVQKRIKKITWEREEKERQRIEAENLREEALRYAQQVKSENEALRQQLESGRGVLLDQAKGRVSAEIEKAKAAYKAAYDSGDPDALLEAEDRLDELRDEKRRYENYKPPQQQAPRPAPQPQYEQQTQQPKRPSELALKWAEKNQWFEKDPEITGYAYGLHQRLVTEGVAPDSEEYYTTIHNAVRRVFPDKFDDGPIEEAPQRQIGNVVAPAARSGKKPRKVQLTSTQVSLAKRLGLTNEQYAAQLMKEASK
ncbi:MAG: hypothetical protein VW683_04365 [Betaproteobacteria bacterium]